MDTDKHKARGRGHCSSICVHLRLSVDKLRFLLGAFATVESDVDQIIDRAFSFDESECPHLNADGHG